MRKRLQLGLVLALVAAAAFVLPATAAAPRVWLASESPLVVRGTGFHPHARVTVTVAKAKHGFRMTSTSGVAGGFVARFSARLPSRCGTVVVTAVDGSGTRAVWRMVANDCGGIGIPGSSTPDR